MSLDEFFNDLGEERTAKIKAATMDLGPAFALPSPSARRHLTLKICLDPSHLMKLGTEALEEVRKDLRREMRKLPSPTFARKFLRGKVGVVESGDPDQTSRTSSLGCQATRGSRSGGLMR
jgi:transposase